MLRPYTEEMKELVVLLLNTPPAKLTEADRERLVLWAPDLKRLFRGMSRRLNELRDKKTAASTD